MLITDPNGVKACPADLLLIAGAPGSGKTTLAHTTDRELVEADQFFELGGNGYEYDHTKIKEAHAWAQERAYQLLRIGKKVVVTGIFARQWERMGYASKALKQGRSVALYFATGEWDNVHGVPAEKVAQIRERIEPYQSLTLRRR